jgi:ABC-type transport system substrate-binding protein
MKDSYWSRSVAGRLSRRRALGGAAGIGLGAAAIALTGCGGGGGGSSTSSSASPGANANSRLLEPVDTTAQAKTGGTFKGSYNSTNPASLDPHTSQGFTTLTAVSVYTYPRLLKFKGAKYPNFTDGSVEGYAVESWELNGDKTQVTLKIRPGQKWDARAPTNGREIDADDVVWNWRKFSSVGVRKSDLVYDPNLPGAPVESMTAADSRTVIVKLHEPNASILQLLASARIFFMVPREAEGGFDSRNEVRGYGPWLLDQYVPSQMFVFKKNPAYIDKNKPFYDVWEQPHVTEYAQRLAQFKAGNIWDGAARGANITQADVLQVSKDVSQANITRDPAGYEATVTLLSWGYEGDSPFKDQRVRQALSMMIDRETVADIISNREAFKKEGFDLATRYQAGPIGRGWGEYWLDPQDSKAFGPTGKYWSTFDLTEAKKLLSAAGFANGINADLNWTPNQYGARYENTVNIIQGMLKEGGVNAKSTPREYTSDYIPNVYYSYTGESSKGFNGMIYRAELAYPTAVDQLFGNYHPAGGRYRGVSPDGKDAKHGDAKLSSMIEAARREFDTKKQISQAHEILKYMAGQAYAVPVIPASLGIVLYWPVIEGYGLYRLQTGGDDITETLAPAWWINQGKPPIKS